MNKLHFALLFLAFASWTVPVIPVARPSAMVTRPESARKPKHSWQMMVPLHDRLVTVTFDSCNRIQPAPDNGDSWPELQAMQNAGYALYCAPGNFYLSQTLVVADTAGGVFLQSWCNIHGAAPAKNTQPAYTTNFVPQFKNAPVIAIQQCKGCTIENIASAGLYTLPYTLNPVQLDTMTFQQWVDTTVTMGPTNPYCFIAIDPFSQASLYDGYTNKMYAPLSGWYLNDPSSSGSTAVNIVQCGVTAYPVGIMETPSWQENGEMINIIDCQVSYCRSAIAFTQAQGKTNTIIRFQDWGGTHTVFDGKNYGVGRADGPNCPYIDVANIVNVHQLLNCVAKSFEVSVKNLYAENVYKIGITGGYASTHFDDCQIELQLSSAGVPSPDCLLYGPNVWFTGSTIRIYNGHATRFVLNQYGMQYVGGCFGAPPVIYMEPETNNFTNVLPAVAHDVNVFYGTGASVSGNAWDSIAYLGSDTVRVNYSNFTGCLIHHIGPMPSVGDLLLTHGYYRDIPGVTSYELPLGYVTSTSADSVYVSWIGEGIRDNTFVLVFDALTKSQ